MINEANAILWHAFKRGNWEAYTRLYNDYYSTLDIYGTKFTRNSSLIEDAIHDFFVRLWTSRENLFTVWVRIYSITTGKECGRR